MRYLYRCLECGREHERQQPMSEPVPETWPAIEPESGELGLGDAHLVPGAELTHAIPVENICFGELHRVYETPATSLGPEYAKYSDNNGYIDRDKYYGRNWAREHNKLS